MWYLFNANKTCYGNCSGEPNHDELKIHDNFAISSDLNIPIERIFLDEDNNIIEAPLPAPTPSEIQKTLTDIVQSHLNNKVKERGYDDIFTACTYAMSTDSVFKAEALACIAWRDAVWRVCYNILAEVMAGLRAIPTIEELLTELPEINWPET